MAPIDLAQGEGLDVGKVLLPAPHCVDAGSGLTGQVLAGVASYRDSAVPTDLEKAVAGP